MLEEFKEQKMDSTYIELCDLLALRSIQDHPQYENWTEYTGREECFQRLLPALEEIYEQKREKMNSRNYLSCFKGLLYDSVNGTFTKMLDKWENAIKYATKTIEFVEDLELEEEVQQSVSRKSLAQSSIADILKINDDLGTSVSIFHNKSE